MNSTSHPPRRRPADAAFTLLEVVIVIAIIVVLVALSTVAVRYASSQARGKTTKQLLENCRGMLAEFERATFMKDVKTDAVDAPGRVDEDGPDREGAVVTQTRLLMGRMRSIPTNRAALEQIPPEKLLPSKKPPTSLEGPVILDGWNNPIIFVPAKGLKNVRNASGTLVTVTSPEERPFWASAGPDGSFSAGADNLYSFQQ